MCAWRPWRILNCSKLQFFGHVISDGILNRIDRSTVITLERIAFIDKRSYHPGRNLDGSNFGCPSHEAWARDGKRSVARLEYHKLEPCQGLRHYNLARIWRRGLQPTSSVRHLFTQSLSIKRQLWVSDELPA